MFKMLFLAALLSFLCLPAFCMNISHKYSQAKTYNSLSKLPLGSVTAKGWIKEQLERSKEGMGGHLDELEPDMIARPFVDHGRFYQLPHHASPDDPTFASGWSAEISGTYWMGLVELAFTLDDPELKAKAEAWVNKVLANQEPEGYLGGYGKDTNRLVDYNPWSANWCYRALLSYYEATERKDVLEAVHKGLLWFCDNFKDVKTDYAGPTIIESLCVVYAYTGDARLLKLAEDWQAWLNENSGQRNRVSQMLSDEFIFGSMHSVAYGEDTKHPAIIYCVNGNEEYRKASVNGFEKALKKQVQKTGAPSASCELLSPVGSVLESEYCNLMTYNHSYSWLIEATGDASWADHIERCLFNGIQGARRKDEKGVQYNVAPNQLYATRDSSKYGDVPDKGAFAPVFYVACCNTKAVGAVPEFVRDMVYEDKEGRLYLTCYGPAEVKSGTLSFEMDTLYPFRDTVTLKITGGNSDILYFRVPEWCSSPSAALNGKKQKLQKAASGYASVAAPLKAGDELVFTFPMKVKISRVDDSYTARRYPLCVERGPIVYAIDVPAAWNTYNGLKITPETDTWPWFEARPDFANLGEWSPWAYALDAKTKAKDIKVVEKPAEGYVWENPPVVLEVPMYRTDAAAGRGCWQFRNYEEWSFRTVEEAPRMVTMVPHGCTNLRVTYVPDLANREK